MSDSFEPFEETTEEILEEPLWKIRLRLFWRGFRENWSIFRRNKMGLTGVILIVLFALFAAAHPIWMHFAQDIQNPGYRIPVYDPIIGIDLRLTEDFMFPYHPEAPSARHWLGTDPTGGDILSQLMYSTRSEFMLGVFSALISVVIGTLVGTIAAYYEGWVDTLFMRLADIMLTFPFIAFLIFLSSVMDLTLPKLAVAIGLIGGFGGITIVLKSQVLSIKVRPYIEAAKVAGGGAWHIMTKHIIPNVMPLSFLYMMFNVTGAILSEATLSYFGLLNVPISWGMMISKTDSYGYLSQFDQKWWLWLPAGVSITLLCAAFYFVGRGLDEIINPKLRKR